MTLKPSAIFSASSASSASASSTSVGGPSGCGSAATESAHNRNTFRRFSRRAHQNTPMKTTRVKTTLKITESHGSGTRDDIDCEATKNTARYRIPSSTFNVLSSTLESPRRRACTNGVERQTSALTHEAVDALRNA